MSATAETPPAPRPGREPRSRRARRTAAKGIALVSMAAIAGCGGGDGSSRVALPNVFDLAHDATAGIAPRDPAATDILPADVLRNRLEKEFTWHGVTLTETMRAAHEGSPAVDAWVAALTANTDDITGAVGVVYGRDGAFAFNQQWAQHTQFLVDYAVALANGDDEGLAQAEEHLRIYAADSGSFFATATGDALPADAVQQLLDTHVDHMLAMIQAVHRGDLDAALAAAIEDNSYLSDIARSLASAIAGQSSGAFPGAIETPEAFVCSIITVETGNYLLRELFAANDGPEPEAAFERATDLRFGDVVGVIDQLHANDPVLVATTADLALDRAYDYARPPAD
ncbi:MAG: hypothetical protein R2713_08745 [Ilumatobacteraceae bacterium]|nr:hypothetical protein [Acidimicrobiales bacterium]